MNRNDSLRREPSVEAPSTLALVIVRGAAALGARRPDLSRLAHIVELDAVLTGATMRVVRCPMYGVRVNGGVVRAVELIGRGAMDRILGSMRVFGGDDAVELACRRWTHSLAVAAASRFISNQGMYEDADEAYLAGLVHDIGRIAGSPGGDRELRGSPGLRAVARWRLGLRVSAVARWQHAVAAGVPVESFTLDGQAMDAATVRLFTAVARGDAMATALGFGDEESAAPSPPSADPDAANVCEAIELELVHAANLLGLPATPAADFAATLARHELRARAQLAGEGPHLTPPARTIGRVGAIHREILDTHGMTSVNDLLERGLREIHEKLSFDRLMLLEPDPVKELTLRPRLAYDPTHLEFTRGAESPEFPLELGGAIARAIESDRACCAAAGGPDDVVLARLGVESFAVAPLKAGGTNLGVVVADQCFSGLPIGEADAAILEMLCSTLGLTLENAALDSAGKLLRSLSEKDELTGINNRRNIFALLSREIDRARRYGKPLSLAMVDVDHFKAWNDVHGHQVGDQVLQSVAQLISSCSREIDAYGRYGGEEFLIVLPETPVDHAMLYCERLRATIENHGEALRAQYPGASLSVSIGLSSLSPHGDDADRIIHRADSALYAAKNHGRNRVCVEMPSKEITRVAVPDVHGVLDEV